MAAESIKKQVERVIEREGENRGRKVRETTGNKQIRGKTGRGVENSLWRE